MHRIANDEWVWIPTREVMGRVIESAPIHCEVHHGWETKWEYDVELEDGVPIDDLEVAEREPRLRPDP